MKAFSEYEMAYLLSRKAHLGQKDKGGNEYFLHPLKVSQMVNGENEKIVALLHDIVEDTTVTLDNLRSFGFSDIIVNAVDSITKRKGEKYEEYIERVKSNELSLKVKIADMKHNSDLSRIGNPQIRDIKRQEKYLNKICELENFLKTNT